jgi:hypothetical protein
MSLVGRELINGDGDGISVTEEELDRGSGADGDMNPLAVVRERVPQPVSGDPRKDQL